jgi:hypothetical protein
MPKWYCGSWAWLDGKSGDVKRYYCGLATCDREHCQKMFWLRRIRLLSALIPKYHLDKFFTLTMKRDLTKEQCWDIISNVWTNTRRSLRRDYKNFLFVAILEAHRDGYPHIHGFTNTWMTTEEWSSRFAACGGGKVAWVEKVKSGDVTEYVSKQFNVVKYVGKSQVVTAQKSTQPKQRTLWRSKGMKADFELEAKTGDWRLEKGIYFDDSEKELDKLYEVKYNEKNGYYLDRLYKPFSEETLCLLRKLRRKSP